MELQSVALYTRINIHKINHITYSKEEERKEKLTQKMRKMTARQLRFGNGRTLTNSEARAKNNDGSRQTISRVPRFPLFIGHNEEGLIGPGDNGSLVEDDVGLG